LNNGNRVIGVEPNTEMRAAAETLLADYPKFQSVAGTAEATTLADASVDTIVAGQAFHWFDVPKVRVEFQRILCGNGAVVLMWNTPKEDATLFMRDYIQLLRDFGTDYKQVVHTNISRNQLQAFFERQLKTHILPNEQRFDRDGLRSRLLSSSFVPAIGHPRHEPMMQVLDGLFDKHNDRGQVRFDYDTEVHIGHLH
jgi:SAM-dependent methyltransferase